MMHINRVQIKKNKDLENKIPYCSRLITDTAFNTKIGIEKLKIKYQM